MSKPTTGDAPNLSVSFAPNEALVLHHFLVELVEELMDRRAEQSSPTAEELVLWKIEAMLDKALVEPFKPNYAELLAEARADVIEQHGFGS